MSDVMHDATQSEPTLTAAPGRRFNYKPLVIAAAIAALILVAWSWRDTDTEAVLSGTIRASTPLIFGGLCGLVGERSGIINIGIEGQMLLAAYAGFMTSSYTAGTGALISILLGVTAGVLASALVGAFMAWCAVHLRMDQIIAGTVVNIFAIGFTSYAYVQGRTQARYPQWSIPGLSELPIVGKAFSQGPLTYLAFAVVIALHIALYRTKWGLRTRSIGEHPGAADAVGISVAGMRYKNMIIAGVLGGLGGMVLLQSASAFNRGMTNGIGFISLAVMLFGRYRPFGVLGAALLFGSFNALQSQMQFRQALDVPPQFFGMIPYLLTIVVLAVAGLAARPPAAAGQPFTKE